MAIFGKGIGVMDVIRCDQDDYLIWKWQPDGKSTEAANRANSIRWGSSLRVREGEVAAFVYTQHDGTAVDYFEGPVDLIVNTDNFPVLATLIGKLYNGSSPFQAEVYFLNLANLIQIKFGVPYFDVFDPRVQEIGVPTAVRGSLNFHIADYRNFIKLHRLSNFDLPQFVNQVKDAVIRYVKQTVINTPDQYGIPVVQLERRISEVSEIIKNHLNVALSEDFGVEVTRVDIAAIDMDKTSAAYKKLASITQNKVATFVQSAGIVGNALNASKSGGKIIDQARKEATAPEAPKGGIDLGEVGKQISDTFNNLFGGLFKGPSTPPPIPKVEFYVAVNSQQQGPYSVDKIKDLYLSGEISRESLVWKDGMKDWEKAETIDALKSIFEASNPPVIPE